MMRPRLLPVLVAGLAATALFAVVIVCTTAAFAAESVASVSALGLDRLHWGMTLNEASQVYPPSRFTPDLISAYQHGDCRYNVRLHFYRDLLDEIVLWHDGDTENPCRDQTERELTLRYGTGIEIFARPGDSPAFSLGNWEEPTTTVTYKFLNGAGHAEVRFEANNEIRRADITERLATEGQAADKVQQCQRIDDEVIPQQHTDCASKPVD